MSHSAILKEVERYYTAKIEEHGPTARGVDWNSQQSQTIRFEQLLKVCSTSPFSINDYGCGYGALAEYISRRELGCQYYGFDISATMVAAARRLHAGPTRQFVDDLDQLPVADFTVASGIFNVRGSTAVEDWVRYTQDTLAIIAARSARGFAFNLLTSYCDQERMRGDLYYGDPHSYFDYCRTHFSRHVALLHDYPLYEFTILVRHAAS